MDPVAVAAVTEAPSIIGMIIGSGFVVQSVLIMLILLSVWSWAITIAKTIQFRRAQELSKQEAQIRSNLAVDVESMALQLSKKLL